MIAVYIVSYYTSMIGIIQHDALFLVQAQVHDHLE